MKENFLFFYKGSHGELHAGLPFLLEIAKKRKGISLYFIYDINHTFANLPDFYKSIIKENFYIIEINKFSSIVFFIDNFFSRNYIVTCDNGHNFYSKSLSFYWPFSRVIFFHHAYALVSQNITDSILDFGSVYNIGHHDPLFVAHNYTELRYRNGSGFKLENIIFSGNIGYKPKWIDKLESNSLSIDKLVEITNEYEKTIFIPTRDKHKLYLSEHNSDYLFSSIESIIRSFNNYFFLIKIHPRQKNIEFFIALEEKYSNCKLVDLNTITLAKISDLVISYWSSAILDALAANTPAVEFHRHEKLHGQLVQTEQGLVSLYHNFGLCPFYKNLEDVLYLLSNPSDWSYINKEQQKIFHEIFLRDYPNFVDDLFERLKRSSFKYKYIVQLYTFPAYYLIKIINKTIKR
jgi:hypothetical protein